MTLLDNIRTVLVSPSHPGNIGAVARALKNMGLQNLYLVGAKNFPHAEATARAAGADDILANATCVATLGEALIGCHLVLGTSARTRAIALPTLEPRAAAEKIVTAAHKQNVAMVFGRESNGLSNEELQQCNYQLRIPSNPEFSSLNLATAVQLVAYEIKMATDLPSPLPAKTEKLASAEEVQLFYNHLQEVLLQIEFLDTKQPRTLLSRLQRLFNRAQLEQKEVNILRGILTAVQKGLRSVD